MKTLSKKNLKKFYNNLQSKRKGIKKRTIVLALFLLGVNIFAWFIYITNANLSLNASIVAWDINFFDDNIETDEMVITSTDLYPGMTPFEKEIVISNKSEMAAVFSYEVKEFNLKGQNSINETMTLDEITNYLENYYPFKISLTYSKEEIPTGEESNFKVNISWEYENTANYYRLNNLYLYNSAVDYYTYNGTSYTKDATVNELNFNDKVASGIYLEKDDADSFWGEECSIYKNNTGLPCINIKLRLIVSQKA